MFGSESSISSAKVNHRLHARLKWAVSRGQKEQIELLLQEGAPVNGPEDRYEYRSPLFSSVYLGNTEVVEKLLRMGASVNKKHRNGDTALTMAAKIERYAIIDLLLMAQDLENCHNWAKLSHLHIACMRNNVSVVKKLIQSKKDINAAVDCQSLYWPGFTALHFAVQFHSTESVEYLLSIGADITIKDARQLTPLHLADMYRSEDIIDLILKAHTNVVSNPVDRHNLSHFHIACTRNNPEVVEFFIKIGVNLQDCIDFGHSNYSNFLALDLALFYECVDVVKILLLNGDQVKSINSDYTSDTERIKYVYRSGNRELVSNLFLTKIRKQKEKFTAISKIPDLHTSCIHDNIENIRGFISEVPSSLNSPLWNGCTPLHLAVINGRDEEVIKMLINQGADYLIPNSDGKTPLHLAFENDVNLIDLIFDDLNEIEQNPVNNDGLSLLHILCANSTVNSVMPMIVENLIKLGYDVNSRVDKNSVFWPGFTPLHFAAKFGCDEVASILLSNGACYSAVDHSNLTAFDWCIKKTYNSYDDERNEALKIMKSILSFHSRHMLYPLDDRGFSLLHVLSFYPVEDVKRMKGCIRENPSDLNKVVSRLGSPYDGYTPLHFAMRFGNQKILELLLEMGANILFQDANGDTPLHMVFECLSIIDISLSLTDSDVLRLNPVGSNGYSLFHIACGMADVELMKCFLEHGADVNLPTFLEYSDIHDRKPLHVVVRQNPARSVEAVELLLKNGANVHARDSKMNTPLHNMRCNSNAEIIDILVSRGADINALNVNFETPVLRASLRGVIEGFSGSDWSIREKMPFFLDNGADINLADENGMTPLTTDFWTDMPDELFDLAEVLLKHVLRLQTIGHHISDTNKKGYSDLLEIFLRRRQFDEIDFKDRCSRESERMLEIYIANGITLHDILSKGLNELAVMSENDAFVRTLSENDFRQKFPIYGPMLESQLRKGRARKPLLREAHEALNYLSGISLPVTCAENIFQTFSNEDLQFVIFSKETQNLREFVSSLADVII